MIEVHPLEGEKLSNYIVSHELPENSAVLMAYEGGVSTGSLPLVIEGTAQDAAAIILDYQASDDFTGELLIRAAVSYAFNRAVPEVKAHKSLQNAVFEKIGFKINEQYTLINTKKVVHFCKK